MKYFEKSNWQDVSDKVVRSEEGHIKIKFNSQKIIFIILHKKGIKVKFWYKNPFPIKV